MLLLAAALAVAAALSGGTTAHAATAAASSTSCSFDPALSCQSTDATVALNSHYSDTSACAFTWHVDWADGSSSDVTDTHPVDGYVLLAQHTYAKVGTYHITDTAQVAGGCTATAGNYYFTLVKPTAPPVTAFSVRGNHPVQPGDDRDTHAQTPKATCSTLTYVKDEEIAGTLIEGWSLLHLGASAELMQHFLSGQGAEIDFDVSSATAQETSKDGAFEQLNKNVQAYVLAQRLAAWPGITVDKPGHAVSMKSATSSTAPLQPLGVLGDRPLRPTRWTPRYSRIVIPGGYYLARGHSGKRPPRCERDLQRRPM